MKANHYTAEQIIKILEQAERGEQTVGAVCREHGVAEATFYRWRKGLAKNKTSQSCIMALG
jgi:putative transposase